MGHYLGEMEEDGIPLSWKVHRRRDAARDRKYSMLQINAAKKKVERFTGKELTTLQAEKYLDERGRREVELKPFIDAAAEAGRKLDLEIVSALLAQETAHG